MKMGWSPQKNTEYGMFPPKNEECFWGGGSKLSLAKIIIMIFTIDVKLIFTDDFPLVQA